MRAFISGTVAISLLAIPTIALAGPDEDMRDAARKEAAELRAKGWPEERCRAGIRFVGNTIVSGAGGLEAGDELIFVGEQEVTDYSDEEIGQVFRMLPPGGAITIRVERGGATKDVEVPCANMADFQNAYLKALDFAGKKDWYDCIDAAAAFSEDPDFIGLQYRCATVSRKTDQYPTKTWLGNIIAKQLDYATYAPEARLEALKALKQNQLGLHMARFNELMETVRTWENGEALLEASQPNWQVLRQGAERSIRARLIDPSSAIIEMPHGFVWGTWTTYGSQFEGYLTCGYVNAKNRMGGYTGSTPFISVVGEAGAPIFADMDSGTSEYFRPVAQGCSNLTAHLPIAPAAMQSTQGAQSNDQERAPSIAEELAKLAELHAAGALNDEEYAAAKASVLTGS